MTYEDQFNRVSLNRLQFQYQESLRFASEHERGVLSGSLPHQIQPELIFDPVIQQHITRVAAAFVTSLAVPGDPTTVAGAVCSATLQHASKLCAFGTHRFSTADEVAAFKKHGEDQRTLHAAEDARLSQSTKTFKVAVPKAPTSETK